MNSPAFPASRKYHLWLALEFGLIFIAIPVFFTLHPGTRWGMLAALWAATAYAAALLHLTSGQSWREIWHGIGWSRAQRRFAFFRFLTAIPLMIGLTCALAPEHLFHLPLQQPKLWLMIMLLYPLLSALPQEVVFRSFFFRRYAPYLPGPWLPIAVNALSFGFLHIMFDNWVSPLLSAAGSLVFALSYHQHRALKWAVLEHALYGCMLFTVGIGFYFVTAHR